MPPRAFTNPAPKTESAREAAKNFFCELCQKGYARSNEYETHLTSRDHQSQVRNLPTRLKEMKQMQRDPMAAEKARRAERKANEESGLVKIDLRKPGGEAKKGGFKKGGFKSAFGEPEKDEETPVPPKKGGFKKAFGGDEDTKEERKETVVPKLADEEEDDSDLSDVDYELYDPNHGTLCIDTACKTCYPNGA
ncbi:uncharacterized protein K452DRAFT_322768 [Aplosporella prunicola CBS 121167]|uniref:C2H2-type domain-containing protein n=1 Tax=Aplosporella prunicola CBS 121167 TaxID=1176127 RepID=A0A6A6AY74_9PEZI|nr:uncharacterized protein K452DRAFT_322768 [Aplosporella prunicola CBS 121167]KAF2135914.1 hypothetical protein K452DRAFT_322768 [Aplosporella prunicola CBS 121167]